MLGSEVLNLISAVYQSYGTIHPSQVCPELSWTSLTDTLDIVWFFFTTDKHQLYSVFVGKLSQCIFKWDETDLNLLKTAKRAEMIQQCIYNPSEDDVIRSLSTAEIALHCKRVTRGTAETTRLISSLLESIGGPRGFDTNGSAFVWQWEDPGDLEDTESACILYPGSPWS